MRIQFINFQNSVPPGPAMPDPTIFRLPIPRRPDEPGDEPHAPRREPDILPFPLPDPAEPDLPHAEVLVSMQPVRRRQVAKQPSGGKCSPFELVEKASAYKAFHSHINKRAAPDFARPILDMDRLGRAGSATEEVHNE